MCFKLFSWIKLIDIINKAEDNLDYQSFYLELISLMCIDGEEKGIRKYQRIIEQ